MGWQVNHGPAAMATFYPAVQFRPSLYRPDVVRLVMKLGSVQKAVEEASKAKPQAVQNVAQVLPPAVVITSPTRTGLRTKKPKLLVKALARSTGKHPVTAMRLLVDGRPYQGLKGLKKIKKPVLGRVGLQWTVELVPGRHTLAVQAESAVSKGVSPPIQVFRTDGKPDRLPNLYMLAVGISDYEGELQLHYAAADAKALVQVFKEKTASVFGKVETRLLTDRQATRKGILEGLAWLNSVMTPQDVGILSFSGHGTKDPEGNFYLVPVDIDVKNPSGTCVSGDLVKRALANMPGRLVAILDACHSGEAAGEKRRAPQAASDDLVRDLVTDDYGVVVMCSSLGREVSMESPEVGHGFFTQGLLEGLGGRADFNRDGYIFIHELNAYAYLRVRQLSGGQQNPTTGKPPTIRSFALSRP
jgi:hypothetical protein